MADNLAAEAGVARATSWSHRLVATNRGLADEVTVEAEFSIFNPYTRLCNCQAENGNQCTEPSRTSKSMIHGATHSSYSPRALARVRGRRAHSWEHAAALSAAVYKLGMAQPGAMRE